MLWWELEVRDASSSWRSLRRRRATAAPMDAHGRVDSARRSTFQNALEQSEQQFRAAAGIGYESRALNLFYGLSQAGRAIAAITPELTGEDWKLKGHGIQADPDRASGSWETLISRPDQRRGASFTTLSAVLKSAATESVPLGELWPLIPESTIFGPPIESITYPALLVEQQQTMNIKAAGRATLTVTVPETLSAVAVERRPSLHEWLARYPDLKGWTPAGEGTGLQQAWPPRHGQLTLYRDMKPGEDSSPAGLSARFVRYRGHDMVFPRLRDEQGARHPLMIWWAVLHGLSMLTRYAPDQWEQAIDVDSESMATRLENLMDVALDAVPDLVDEVIAAWRR